jgi:diacylglycerol kinase (ATP)
MSDHWYSLTRLSKATGYSLAGLRAAWIQEASFRFEVIVAVPLMPLALWWGESGLQRALLIGSLLLILLVELLNSGVEAAVDRVSLDHNPLSERAKDLGSAAVFVAILNAVIVWTLILSS